MRILLTNDDGVFSQGLLALKEHLSRKHDVCVVAPERERTCVAHAITLHKPLRIKEHGDRVFSSNGTPADCVLLGARVVIPEGPDLIISGINTGPNMGRDVSYSGTVAAAKEGSRIGIQSIAVSINARSDFLFHEAVVVVERFAELIHGKGLPRNVFFNVNLPNIPREAMKGFMMTRLGKRIYNDIIIERTDPRGRKYYWIGGDGDGFRLIKGTDFFAVQNGYVSVTPIDSEGGYVALTHYNKIFREGV